MLRLKSGGPPVINAGREVERHDRAGQSHATQLRWGSSPNADQKDEGQKPSNRNAPLNIALCLQPVRRDQQRIGAMIK